MFYRSTFKPAVEDIGSEKTVKQMSIMRYMENTAAYHSDAVGYGMLDIEENGFSWFLTEWRAKFIKPLFYGEKIIVETWGRGLVNPYSCMRDFIVYRESGEICVKASSLWSDINVKTMSMEKITDKIIIPYECEDNSVFGSEKLKRLREPKSYDSQITMKIRRSDIDLNGHVNNIRYLELAEEILDSEISCTELRLSYRKQTKAHETIICKRHSDMNTNTVGIYGTDGTLRSIAEMKSR